MTGGPPEGKLRKEEQNFQLRVHQRLAYFRKGPSLERPNIFSSTFRPNFAHRKNHLRLRCVLYSNDPSSNALLYLRRASAMSVYSITASYAETAR